MPFVLRQERAHDPTDFRPARLALGRQPVAEQERELLDRRAGGKRQVGQLAPRLDAGRPLSTPLDGQPDPVLDPPLEVGAL